MYYLTLTIEDINFHLLIHNSKDNYNKLSNFRKKYTSNFTKKLLSQKVDSLTSLKKLICKSTILGLDD